MLVDSRSGWFDGLDGLRGLGGRRLASREERGRQPTGNQDLWWRWLRSIR
jgi:hypothetical protein